MKLASYLSAGKESFGVVTERGICDLPSVWPDGPRSVLEALQGGPDTLRQIERLCTSCEEFLSGSDVELLAPVPAPPKVIGLAQNYGKHLDEASRAKGLNDRVRSRMTPRPFLMPATAVIGPGAEICWPCYSRQIDYELELAIVIGTACKCVSADEAERFIAGYTIANDVSARSTTFSEGRDERPWDDFYDWLGGKWADGFCPMGPYLVTADEVGDPQKLDLALTVNGQLRQQATTAEMLFGVFELVSFLSHIMSLVPGDVIATGTPAGVGMAGGDYLEGGDEITCRIEKIGELTNTLGRPPCGDEPFIDFESWKTRRCR